jgi:ElaA protein
MIKELSTFDELTPAKLYEILKLRSTIFVVEQQSIYLDADGHDPHCLHYTYYHNHTPIAYSRILPPRTVYEQASIGRVCVEKSWRHKGLGRMIFGESLQILLQSFGPQPIKIQAQLYLKDFYRSFGFEPITEPYDDCGILHIDMLRP